MVEKFKEFKEIVTWVSNTTDLYSKDVFEMSMKIYALLKDEERKEADWRYDRWQ